MQPETLRGLLQLLHSDEEQAAEEYRKLHQRLVRFLEWNGVDDPFALADTAIDRLAQRAAKERPFSYRTGNDAANGTDDVVRVGVLNASTFALGIARHLIQEEARRRAREAEVGRHLQAEARLKSASPSSADEGLEEALRACLARLPRERRELIQAYYSYSEGGRQRTHQSLADRLGLSLNALRNRALRARQDLEECMRAGRP